ncbi:MAG TPA: 2-oxoglutarate dehydrogenase complex dihydrolipoyllysine-residue succinyltransferase [Acidobacteriota bacterium]|nr:2-oxoglutarate dehydrogenase complex dihydrolipoyllysine-residue succinyltransferase [Acidobacteriota bacterium]HQF87014.1 2-oxoglutarate dehydrogenase complex dihydrolipoyllysine-residue succinyltransferase [Acidobacteriota bacterium]HQG91575.1 2-oxoglutarate dehydrogenase complex dihydrolipoyllysine-residue succinyltransferase [Acidobacteriota bacterium]
MVIQVKVPAVGESVSEAVVGRWFKESGDYVRVDEPVCEIESEKATMELNAEAAGRLTVTVPTGRTVPIGAVIAEIDTAAAPPAGVAAPPRAADAASPAPATAALPAPPAVAVGESSRTRFTPVARKLLADAGVSADRITAVPGARVTKRDVLEALTPARQQPAAPAADQRPVRRERMTTLRGTIARRLVAAKNETAMLTTINELDMSAVMDLRARHQEAFTAKHGVKLGFMSLFTWAVCRALAEMPVINAQVSGADIVYPEYCDIGISVSTPKGLVVPVIRDAHLLDVPRLEAAIQALAERARAGKLSVDEMSGGTFTITNGGVFGSLISTPIINYPQSAILGMHTIKDRPVAVDGQVVIRPMMYVSLSYDHRIIDGRESVTFVIRVKELLENSTVEWLHL